MGRVGSSSARSSRSRVTELLIVHRRLHTFRRGWSSGLDPDGGRFHRPVRLFRSRFHESRFRVTRYLVFLPSLRIGCGLLRCAFSTARYGSFGLRQFHVPRFRVVRYLAFYTVHYRTV
jgi:hypothetical protein